MKILVLSTWFPYPCNQGSKTRAYHLIKGLAKRHQIALISFEDQPVQPDWIEHMREFCEVVQVVPQKPFASGGWKSIAGLFSLKPAAAAAGYSPEMSKTVRKISAEWHPDMVFALTFVTAPYALELPGLPRVVDADNLLTLMLHEHYLQARSVLQRARRYLAYWKFRRYERILYQPFELCLVVSPRDTQRVLEYIPFRPEQVGLVRNGVDTNLNQPGLAKPGQHALIFNGALTYEPNLDAVRYFLLEIFPLIQRELPDTRLRVTGRTEGVPTQELRAVNGGLQFTGYLDDIRPTIAGSQVCVVPLRMGAGTRLKILEAMALGTPVISTSKGAEGLEVENGKHLLIADTPVDFAFQTIQLLKDPVLCQNLSTNALKLVREQYDWALIGQQFCDLVDSIPGRQV